jgi:hypothetical protein
MNRLIENTVFSGFVTGLPLRDLTDQPLTRLGEGHDRRRQPAAFGVGDDDGLSASMTATTELVVPRSIPMILLMNV